MSGKETCIKKLWKWLRSSLSKARVRIHADWLHTKIIYANRWSAIKSWSSDHFETFAERLAIVFSIIITIFILSAIDTNHISNGAVANLFIGIGTMSGTVLAILFSLSLFSIQNSSHLYSSSFFEVYTHGLKEKCSYAFLAFATLAFFALSIVWSEEFPNTNSLLKLLSLCSILPSLTYLLVLSARQFRKVRKQVNPVHAITFLEEKSISFLSEIDIEVNRLTRFVAVKNCAKESEPVIQSIVSNKIVSANWENLNRQIENLVEISMKLSSQHEVSSVNRGMLAISNILIKFMKHKQTCSQALPSTVAPLAWESDSQNFIGPILERLNWAGEEFIKNNRTQNATTLLKIYYTLIDRAKNIKFINTSTTNPILAQMVGYFKAYIDIGIRMENIEVVYQAISVLENAANEIPEELGTPSWGLIQRSIMDIASFGFKDKKTFIVSACIASLSNILNTFIEQEVDSIQISGTLEEIQKLILLTNAAQNFSYFSNDIGLEYSINLTFHQLGQELHLMVNCYSKKNDGEEKRQYFNYMIEVFEKFYRFLRNISEQLKNCDNAVSQNTSILVFKWNHLIIDLLKNESSSNNKERLKDKLSWNIHLPSWFAIHSLEIKYSIYSRELIEAPVKTGLILLAENIDDQLIGAALDASYSIVKQLLKKLTGRYGNDELSAMKEVCYLGVLVLKNHKNELFEKTLSHIRNFEEAYEQKYTTSQGLPRAQLKETVLNWEHNFQSEQLNRMRRGESEDLILDMVSVTDIHRFTFAVWGIVPDNSPIKDELLAQMQKTKT